MAFLESKWLIAIVGLALFYIAYRFFSRVNKSQRVYNEQFDTIINSEEHKVKGRFE